MSVILLLGDPFTVSGQEFVDKEIRYLDQLVVTGARVETSLKDSPAAIWSMDREEIANRSAATPAELLEGLPGVFLADSTVPGLPRLRIRGEDPRRSLVLIDGQEISDHSSFGPPLLIDPSQIERIELVRGSQSALYGSRAAGGVVNIITRSPEEDGIHGGGGASYIGATHGYRSNLWVGGREDNWYYRFAASATEDSDRRTPSGVLANSSFESDSLSAQIGWKRGGHDLRFIYDQYRLSSEAPPRTDLPPIFSKLIVDFPRRDREKFAVFYEGNDISTHLSKLQINAYYQTTDREFTQKIAGLDVNSRPPSRFDYFTEDEDTIHSTGLNLQSDWKFGEQHTVVAGVNVLNDDLDKRNFRKSQLPPFSKLQLDTKAEILTTASYLQDTWTPFERLDMIGGLRHYWVESELTASTDPALQPRASDDSETVASLAVVYRPTEQLSVRASWSQGYVYPTLLQLHTGSLVGTGGITRPNPDLAHETSDTYEIGARFEDDVWSIDLTAFYTRAKNYIALVDAAELPSLGWLPGEQTYANLNSATSHGIEAMLKMRAPDQNSEIYLQGTWLDRELEFSNFSTSKTGLPSLSGRIGARWFGFFNTTHRWQVDTYIAAGGKSTERTARATTTADAWGTLNVVASLMFDNGSIGLEFLNLNNEEYRPSTDQLTQAGRHVNLIGRFYF